MDGQGFVSIGPVCLKVSSYQTGFVSYGELNVDIVVVYTWIIQATDECIENFSAELVTRSFDLDKFSPIVVVEPEQSDRPALL